MAKKRANGEGNIRKRSNGIWEGRVTIDGVAKSVYGKTHSDVRIKLTEIRNDLDHDDYVDPADTRLKDWLELWQSEYLEDVKLSTADRYKSLIRIHIIPELGNIRLMDLRSSAIQAFLNQCKKKKGLSEKSVKNIRLVLHKALEKAVEDEQLKKNPCDKAKVPSYDEPPAEMRPLKDKEVSLFLDAIKGKDYEHLFYVALFTGMRESELIGLTWDCIDFERGTIHLYRQYKKARGIGGQYVFTSLKNKQSRTFSPPQNVLDVLKKVKLQQAEWRLKTGSQWQNRENLVFTSPLGKHICTATLYFHFKDVVAKIGLPEVRFHDLRHSYATLALQNGIDVKTVSNNMGHSTTAFTMDKYAHVTETMMRDSAEKMQRFIASL